jgi:hypothetical protein
VKVDAHEAIILQFFGDIIERVALLIRYGTIRMAERCRVCGRRLAKTGLSVGGVCLGAFGKYRDLPSEALATRSSFDFGMKSEWHVHCGWLPLFTVNDPPFLQSYVAKSIDSSVRE